MTRVFETTARIEDSTHLVLETPLHPAAAGRVKVSVVLENEKLETVSKPDFSGAIGAAYRYFPDMPKRSTSEWMREIREGEEA
jgi:hypothetical protein